MKSLLYNVVFILYLKIGMCPRCSLTHFKLLHEFADSLAASSDDACVDPVIQPDVLAHHLLQFCNHLLYSCLGLLHIPLITPDQYRVLRKEER